MWGYFPIFLALWCPGIYAQQQWTFCRWWYHASVNIDDKIYISGGLSTYHEDRKNGTLWVDPTVFSIDLKPGVSFPVTYRGREYQGVPAPDIPGQEATISPSLWYDNSAQALYKFNGYFMNSSYFKDPEGLLTVRAAQLWKLNLSTYKWEKPSPGGDRVQRVSSPGYISVPKLGKGYSIGGAIGPETDPVWKDAKGQLVLDDSLVEFNFASQSFRNKTTPNVGPVLMPNLVYVPGHKLSGAGADGFLVMLGGVSGARSQWMYTREELVDGTKQRPTNIVDVYDIRADKWYKQKTTGASPPSVLGACAVGVAAQDNSSFQIFFYGGATPFGPVHSDMWALTLPSFQWVQVDSSGEKRYGHTCHVVKGNTMAVIGGRDQGQDDQPGPDGKWLNGVDFWTCPDDGIISAFDLNDWEWRGEVKKSPGEYLVHKNIVAVIGGNQRGKANQTKPLDGWNEKALGEAMERPLIPDDGPTVTPTPHANTGEKSKPSGAIIGGAVGGAVALIAICIGIFIWRKKRRPAPEPQMITGPQPPMTHDSAQYPFVPVQNWQAPPYRVTPGSPPPPLAVPPYNPYMSGVNPAYYGYVQNGTNGAMHANTVVSPATQGTSVTMSPNPGFSPVKDAVELS